MTQNTILITGANGGLGKALVLKYLSRPSTIVIAAVRNPATTSLHALPKGANSSLIIVKIDSTSETDPAEAIKTLQTAHNIKSLDLVIANAGIFDSPGRIESVDLSAIKNHFMVNSLALVVLFQAVFPLLQKGAKFVYMSTTGGSIGGLGQEPSPFTAYGSSKALGNWFTRKIHSENEHIIAFPISPGWVQTEMGNAGAKYFGMNEAAMTIEQSITGMVKVIDAATREKTSGRFMTWEGEEYPW